MNHFKLDYIRYKELSLSNPWKEPSVLLIYLYRLCKRNELIKIVLIRNLFYVFLIPLYRFYSIFLGVSIPRSCNIGSGFVIFHYGAIALNPLVKIGKNCTIRQGVTIGNRKTNIDVPTIGDNVDIGAGAVLIGEIKIGNNVSIGANAVVLTDVPDNYIAVGNPARIIKKK